jgi:hypothetical protein
LTGKHPIRPTSPSFRRSRRLEPGRRSTYPPKNLFRQAEPPQSYQCEYASDILFTDRAALETIRDDLVTAAITALGLWHLAFNFISQPAGEQPKSSVALNGEAVPFLGHVIWSMGAQVGAANL